MFRSRKQLLYRTRWHVALFAVFGVLWVWLERVHTLLFATELVHNQEATTIKHLATSAEAQTLLLVAILVTCIGCLSILRRREARKRAPHRARRSVR